MHLWSFIMVLWTFLKILFRPSRPQISSCKARHAQYLSECNHSNPLSDNFGRTVGCNLFKCMPEKQRPAPPKFIQDQSVYLAKLQRATLKRRSCLGWSNFLQITPLWSCHNWALETSKTNSHAPTHCNPEELFLLIIYLNLYEIILLVAVLLRAFHGCCFGASAHLVRLSCAERKGPSVWRQGKFVRCSDRVDDWWGGSGSLVRIEGNRRFGFGMSTRRQHDESSGVITVLCHRPAISLLCQSHKDNSNREYDDGGEFRDCNNNMQKTTQRLSTRKIC